MAEPHNHKAPPTWTELLPLLLATWCDGVRADGHTHAAVQLNAMAKAADAYAEAVREGWINHVTGN